MNPTTYLTFDRFPQNPWILGQKEENEKEGSTCEQEHSSTILETQEKLAYRCEADADAILELINPYLETFPEKAFYLTFQKLMELPSENGIHVWKMIRHRFLSPNIKNQSWLQKRSHNLFDQVANLLIIHEIPLSKIIHFLQLGGILHICSGSVQKQFKLDMRFLFVYPDHRVQERAIVIPCQIDVEHVKAIEDLVSYLLECSEETLNILSPFILTLIPKDLHHFHSVQFFRPKIFYSICKLIFDKRPLLKVLGFYLFFVFYKDLSCFSYFNKEQKKIFYEMKKLEPIIQSESSLKDLAIQLFFLCGKKMVPSPDLLTIFFNLWCIPLRHLTTHQKEEFRKIGVHLYSSVPTHSLKKAIDILMFLLRNQIFNKKIILDYYQILFSTYSNQHGLNNHFLSCILKFNIDSIRLSEIQDFNPLCTFLPLLRIILQKNDYALYLQVCDDIHLAKLNLFPSLNHEHIENYREFWCLILIILQKVCSPKILRFLEYSSFLCQLFDGFQKKQSVLVSYLDSCLKILENENHLPTLLYYVPLIKTFRIQLTGSSFLNEDLQRSVDLPLIQIYCKTKKRKFFYYALLTMIDLLKWKSLSSNELEEVLVFICHSFDFSLSLKHFIYKIFLKVIKLSLQAQIIQKDHFILCQLFTKSQSRKLLRESAQIFLLGISCMNPDNTQARRSNRELIKDLLLFFIRKRDTKCLSIVCKILQQENINEVLSKDNIVKFNKLASRAQMILK